MRELQNPFWIKLKAALFLVAGVASAALLLADRPTLKTAFLVVAAIWSFCRLYYFMFSVMERYVDEGYRFSGAVSFVGYLFRKKRA